MAECIARRRANIAKTIEGRKILEECRGAARRRGTPARTYWWEQELTFEGGGQGGGGGGWGKTNNRQVYLVVYPAERTRVKNRPSMRSAHAPRQSSGRFRWHPPVLAGSVDVYDNWGDLGDSGRGNTVACYQRDSRT